MPSSQFVTNLLTLHKNSLSPDFLKKNPRAGKLQATLKKDLKDFNNLGRFFDELPSDLIDKTTLASFEKYFLSLFKSPDYPKAKTGYLIDRIILQGCHDLLNNDGSLNEELVGQVGSVEAKDEYKRNTVLLNAYLLYFTGLLSEKVGPTEQQVMDAGILKEVSGPSPRATIITLELNQNRNEHITDLIEKTRFAHALKECSTDIFLHYQVPMLEYCRHIKKWVAQELRSTLTVEQKQTQQFWIDVMYICKELGDYNTFIGIYSALRLTDVKAFPDETIALKYRFCEKLANPKHDYKNIADDAKLRFKSDEMLIPFCLHSKKDDALFTHGLDAKSKNWQTPVDKLFVKDHFHHNHIAKLTSVAGEKIAKLQATLHTFMNTLSIEAGKLKPDAPESPRDESNALKQVFRFFKSTFDQAIIDNALDTIQILWDILLQPRVSVLSIKQAAFNAQRDLKEVSVPDNKHHPLTKAVTVLSNALIEMQNTCTMMLDLGQETIPGFKAPTAEAKQVRVLAKA